jgi:Uri superfamily endonuclease
MAGPKPVRPAEPDLLLCGAGRFVARADEAPGVAGAYLLLVTLPAPLWVAVPGRGGATLPPGRFLYAGSARGPGGIRARLGRHLRRAKTPHWHIDLLTAAGTAEGAWVFPGGDECAIVAALAHLPAPLPGFGSSDCRHCVSHLLAWPDGVAHGAMGEGGAGGIRCARSAQKANVNPRDPGRVQR